MKEIEQAIKSLAEAITDNCAAGTDATGGRVSCLTEAIMGITAGLSEVASAISEAGHSIADAMKARNELEYTTRITPKERRLNEIRQLIIEKTYQKQDAFNLLYWLEKKDPEKAKEEIPKTEAKMEELVKEINQLKLEEVFISKDML